MAVQLSSEEKQKFNNTVTNKPAAIIPVGNTDVEVQLPSGIDQEIVQIDADILETTTKVIPEYVNEISMKMKIITYYNNIIQRYEQESKYSTGEYHAETWDISNVSEAKNVQKNAISAYFPQGILTTNRRELPSDNHTLSTYYTNNLTHLARITTDKHTVYGAAYVFRTSYPPHIRLKDDTTGWTAAQITAYHAKKSDLTTRLTEIITAFNQVIALLGVPYPDDFPSPEAGIPSPADSAAARLIEVQNQKTPYFHVLNNSYYTDIVLNQITTTLSDTVRTTALERIILTGTHYRKKKYYSIRKTLAVSLVDRVEGTIYKKLAAEQSVIDFQNKKKQLLEDKEAYENTEIA